MTDAQIEAWIALCDRCKYREIGPPGQGKERFILGPGGTELVTVDDKPGLTLAMRGGCAHLWLCDACWLEVCPVKGGA